MTKFYLKPTKKTLLHVAVLIAVLFTLAAPTATQAQGLVFRDGKLYSGRAGEDGAVYRFLNVTNNVNALVKIVNRSSSDVKLNAIDINSTGWDKAFQPQIFYKNRNASLLQRDWWMEFEISFVSAITNSSVTLDNMDVTAIDIDGDSYNVNEWVTFYNLDSYTTERRTLLSVTDVLETVLNVLKVTGKKFAGPITTYDDIDTSATRVMASTKYANKNRFRLRTGGHSDSRDIDAERMYSFWFKSFNYTTPVEGSLPVVLSAFTAKKNGSQAILNWTTDVEENVSHFAVEKSQNGKDFTDAGIVFTEGNSTLRREYSFKDELKSSSGLVYYRLKIVDLDGKYTQSAIKIIRLNEDNAARSITVYPNPVVNEVRVTLASAWQEKAITIQVLNSNGLPVIQMANSRPGQTETINVSKLTPGMYLIRVTNGAETTTQQFIKVK